MTPADLAAKLGPWREQILRWGPLIGALVLALVLVRQCNGRRGAEAALEAERKRTSEARQLADAGVEVVEQEEQRDVDAYVHKLEAQNADLKRANEQLRRAAPDARATGAIKASTGRVVAGGAPRPTRPSGEGGKEEQAPGSPAGPSNPPTPGNCPPCLLAEGDPAEVRLEGTTWRTGKGNDAVTLALGAYRLDPGGPVRLFGGPADLELTHALETATPAKQLERWGAGPLVVGTQTGVALGVLVATPRARVPLLGWQVEALAGGAAGPSGTWAATASIVLRP